MHIEEKHRPDQGDRAKPTMATQDIHERIQARLESKLSKLADTGLVCPKWNGLRVNEWIKGAALEFKWPSNRSWRGAHNLRDGLATEIAITTGSRSRVKDFLGHKKTKRIRPVQAVDSYILGTDLCRKGEKNKKIINKKTETTTKKKAKKSSK